MDTTKQSQVDQAQATKDPLMRGFKDVKPKNSSMKYLIIFIVVIFLGVGSGYVLSSKNTATDSTGQKTSLLGAEKGKIFGEKSADDLDGPAEGTVKEGGIDGEGAYHLERTGGESQTVYMTSSSVDIGQFVNKKIRVWGKTQTAQSAGWLLDVTRLEVL